MFVCVCVCVCVCVYGDRQHLICLLCTEEEEVIESYTTKKCLFLTATVNTCCQSLEVCDVCIRVRGMSLGRWVYPCPLCVRVRACLCVVCVVCIVRYVLCVVCIECVVYDGVCVYCVCVRVLETVSGCVV